jgi:hypothetical protein
LLWTRESESKEESNLPLDSRQSPSPRKSPIALPLDLESKLDSRVRVQGRARFALNRRARMSPSPRWSPICDLARHLLRPDLLGRALFYPLRKRALF